jgi:hypothetical protein
MIAWNRFIEGKRLEGFKYACKCLQRKTPLRKMGKIIAFGLVGPHTLVFTHLSAQRLKQKIASRKI